LHRAVAATRAALGLLVLLAVGALAVSGGSGTDPRTPAALPGLPPPFLGTAVVGSGGRTAAVDAYGSVVGLWALGPAGRSLIHNPADRQAAGTVPDDTGIVARMPLGDGTIPLWRADSVRQRYVPGTNVLRTVARVGERSFAVTREIGGAEATRSDRRWLARARPLGDRAPAWARRLYLRSLLVLRALTDRRTGAVAAGARDGWAYVWPRDAGAVAIALASAGYRDEARRVVHFLRGLDLEAAARFDGDGKPVEGRAAQGDAAGWVAAAAEAAGVPADVAPQPWRGRADYQESGGGEYLANAIASGVPSALIRDGFAHRKGLVRIADDPDSGTDSAVAWAVKPFPRSALFPLVRRSLLRTAAAAGRYGIVPSEHWGGGDDPWTAPTAWTAWSLAALGERRAALRLMACLRRAATPLDLLPERVDVRTGIPTSTTPLAWSHAFAILAMRELWPSGR
jgi:Glycosyl hydrolases family 15